MSHMKEVAKILGVDIGEKFKIEVNGAVHSKNLFLTDYGLFVVGDVACKTEVLNQLLNGEYKVVKIPQPILTEEEKEYLSYVTRPFIDSIEYIHKEKYFYGTDSDCIEIKFYDGGTTCFPPFKKNSMYKGMELDKEYTMEELGLRHIWNK